MGQCSAAIFCLYETWSAVDRSVLRDRGGQRQRRGRNAARDLGRVPRDDCPRRSRHLRRLWLQVDAKAHLTKSRALRIARGSAVALVEFLIPNYRGRGRRRYDASSPGTVRSNGGAGRHRAQSDDGRSRRLLYRNIRKRYRLASPQRWPTRAQRSVSGTVHAKLRLQLATRRLRLDGNWHCRILIPLEVNGG